MDTINKATKSKYRQKDSQSVYSSCQITKSIMLPITTVGKNLRETLGYAITKMVGEKCIVEGYVKPSSVEVITYSSGLVKGDQVIFDVVYKCEVCFLVSGMKLNCIAKNITKAGIRAESADETPSPFVLFIARDHFYSSDYFNSIEENEKIVVRVIAQRFELNDKYVSVIAELVSPPKKDFKPRIEFTD